MATLIKEIQVHELTPCERMSIKDKDIIQRVLKINDTYVPNSRELYVDTHRRFHYRCGDEFFRYKDSFGIQRININGITYTAKGVDFLINNGQEIKPLDILMGKEYRVENGMKVLIINYVDKPQFFPQKTFIGIYEGGTIRFDVNGNPLSHARLKEWTIKEEWKEQFIWVVTIINGPNYESATFTSEKHADRYINEIEYGKTCTFVTKTTIAIKN
jgi:hypothetical protein